MAQKKINQKGGRKILDEGGKGAKSTVSLCEEEGKDSIVFTETKRHSISKTRHPWGFPRAPKTTYLGEKTGSDHIKLRGGPRRSG